MTTLNDFDILLLTADETCRAWQTWGQLVAGEKHIILRALAQYGVYIALAASRPDPNVRRTAVDKEAS